MPAQDWKLVENQFDIITRHSRRRMNVIALDHLTKLGSIKGNVHVTALYTRTQPLVTTWTEQYGLWVNTKAIHEGVNRQVEGKLEELTSTKVGKWDSAVLNAYPLQASKYQLIFPLGRTPFLVGTPDERVLELRALAARIRSMGDLDSLAREIEVFSTDLEALRTVQQRLEEEVVGAREALEPHRQLLATMLYRNLGALIEIYAEDPSQIGVFYDFQLLQEPGTPDEDDGPGPEFSQDLQTHMAPMVGSLEPPIAITGRRVTPPGGKLGA